MSERMKTEENFTIEDLHKKITEVKELEEKDKEVCIELVKIIDND